MKKSMSPKRLLQRSIKKRAVCTIVNVHVLYFSDSNKLRQRSGSWLMNNTGFGKVGAGLVQDIFSTFVCVELKDFGKAKFK